MKIDIAWQHSIEFGRVQIATFFKWRDGYYIKTAPFLPVKTVNACKLSDGTMCCFDDCDIVDIVPVKLTVGW